MLTGRVLTAAYLLNKGDSELLKVVLERMNQEEFKSLKTYVATGTFIMEWR